MSVELSPDAFSLACIHYPDLDFGIAADLWASVDGDPTEFYKSLASLFGPPIQTDTVPSAAVRKRSVSRRKSGSVRATRSPGPALGPLVLWGEPSDPVEAAGRIRGECPQCTFAFFWAAPSDWFATDADSCSDFATRAVNPAHSDTSVMTSCTVCDLLLDVAEHFRNADQSVLLRIICDASMSPCRSTAVRAKLRAPLWCLLPAIAARTRIQHIERYDLWVTNHVPTPSIRPFPRPWLQAAAPERFPAASVAMAGARAAAASGAYEDDAWVDTVVATAAAGPQTVLLRPDRWGPVDVDAKPRRLLDTELPPAVLGLRDGMVIRVVPKLESERLLRASETHALVAHTFARVGVTCAVCGGVVWGLNKQGCRCIHCKLAVHHKCVPMVNSLCLARGGGGGALQRQGSNTGSLSPDSRGPQPTPLAHRPSTSGPAAASPAGSPSSASAAASRTPAPAAAPAPAPAAAARSTSAWESHAPPPPPTAGQRGASAWESHAPPPVGVYGHQQQKQRRTSIPPSVPTIPALVEADTGLDELGVPYTFDTVPPPNALLTKPQATLPPVSRGASAPRSRTASMRGPPVPVGLSHVHSPGGGGLGDLEGVRLGPALDAMVRKERSAEQAAARSRDPSRDAGQPRSRSRVQKRRLAEAAAATALETDAAGVEFELRNDVDEWCMSHLEMSDEPISLKACRVALEEKYGKVFMNTHRALLKDAVRDFCVRLNEAREGAVIPRPAPSDATSCASDDHPGIDFDDPPPPPTELRPDMSM